MQGMQRGLRRQIISKLRKAVSRFPAVALLGVRQIGKTTLAKAGGKTTDAIYLDLEAPRDLLKLSDPTSFFEKHDNKLIILDEIQRTPDLFMILRGIIERNREQGRRSGQFLLLGSASMDLLRQSSESLAGRISYIEMSGLNLLEVNAHKGRNKNRDKNKLQRLWLRGGFPDSYLANEDDMAMDWLESLIRTYMERDVPQMGFRIPSARLRRLWTMLAHLQGELVNHSRLAVNLETDSKTVSYYLDVLTDIFLIRRLEPYYANVKKRLVKTPRYYVRDSGIQHCLLGISDHDQLLSNPILGKSWEGFVIENLHSVLPSRTETYFYRTAAGAEIDLIIKMPSSEIWAIEIKYGIAPKISKHYSRICDDVGANKKYVVYGGDDEFPVGDLTFISLVGLMKELQSL